MTTIKTTWSHRHEQDRASDLTDTRCFRRQSVMLWDLPEDDVCLATVKKEGGTHPCLRPDSATVR